MDLMQNEDYPADSCAISPKAFLFIFKCGTLSKFGLRTRCINLNKCGIYVDVSDYVLGNGRNATLKQQLIN